MTNPALFFLDRTNRLMKIFKRSRQQRRIEDRLPRHLKIIKPERITNKFLRFEENRKIRVSWVKDVHKGLEVSEITKEVIGNRNEFKTNICKGEGLTIIAKGLKGYFQKICKPG